MRAPRLDTIRRLVRARDGVSAIEFALVLPVMLVIVLAGYELSRMSAVSRKVTLTTRAVADLTTQNVSMTSTSLNTTMSASAQIFAPYSTSTLSIVVSELSINAAGIATVVWSQALNGTPLPKGQIQSVTAGIVQINSYIILCTVTYSYTPLVSSLFGSGRTLTDQIYMNPRLSSSISLSG